MIVSCDCQGAVYASVCLPVCLSVCVFVCLYTFVLPSLSQCVFMKNPSGLCLSVHLKLLVCAYPSVCLRVYLHARRDTSDVHSCQVQTTMCILSIEQDSGHRLDRRLVVAQVG